jgi:hypothetical protein
MCPWAKKIYSLTFYDGNIRHVFKCFGKMKTAQAATKHISSLLIARVYKTKKLSIIILKCLGY